MRCIFLSAVAGAGPLHQNVMTSQTRKMNISVTAHGYSNQSFRRMHSDNRSSFQEAGPEQTISTESVANPELCRFFGFMSQFLSDSDDRAAPETQIGIAVTHRIYTL
jgi:hypothetical protein